MEMQLGYIISHVTLNFYIATTTQSMIISKYNKIPQGIIMFYSIGSQPLGHDSLGDFNQICTIQFTTEAKPQL